MVNSYNKEKKIANFISIGLALAVALIGGVFRDGRKIPLGDWTMFLPHIYGHLNLLTAFLLVIAVIAVKNKKYMLHRNLMNTSFVIGALFLILYILYHISQEEQKFQGEGIIRYVYFTLLISHIFVAMFVVRYVLLSIFYARAAAFEEHKKVVKYAFPLWFYVSLTGYIVYQMVQF